MKVLSFAARHVGRPVKWIEDRREHMMCANHARDVECEVEIWPTSMVFRKGHRLRLDIQPRDGIGSAPYTHYAADYNTGTNTVFCGGSQASYLLLPVIPSIV